MLFFDLNGDLYNVNTIIKIKKPFKQYSHHEQYRIVIVLNAYASDTTGNQYVIREGSLPLLEQEFAKISNLIATNAVGIYKIW